MSTFGYNDLPDATDRPLSLRENMRAELSLSDITCSLTGGGGKPGQGYAAVVMPYGVTPINIAAGLRNDDRTGVGTPGTGIGEEGDPSPTLSAQGATPAAFIERTGVPAIEDCTCCPKDPEPDSPRYKAVGNAVTTNVIEWIGHRLHANIDWESK